MAGIVLAGGKSARMGEDKARLPYVGTTLLAHVIETLRLLTPSIVVVMDQAGKYALPPDVQVAVDLFPNAGPLGGLVTGLTAVEDGYHFVVACDMPHLHPALLSLLYEAADGFDAAVPEVEGRCEPLCAVYHRRCVDRLRDALERGERAVHRALRSLAVNRVGEETLRRADPDLRSLQNLNTPADYRACIGE